MLLKTDREWKNFSGFSLPPAFQSFLVLLLAKSSWKPVDEGAWETAYRGWSLCIRVEQRKAEKDLGAKGPMAGNPGHGTNMGLTHRVFPKSLSSCSPLDFVHAWLYVFGNLTQMSVWDLPGCLFGEVTGSVTSPSTFMFYFLFSLIFHATSTSSCLLWPHTSY